MCHSLNGIKNLIEISKIIEHPVGWDGFSNYIKKGQFIDFCKNATFYHIFFPPLDQNPQLEQCNLQVVKNIFLGFLRFLWIRGMLMQG